MAFRAAFITGASSGFGHALGRELARSGTRVVLAARRIAFPWQLSAAMRMVETMPNKLWNAVARSVPFSG